MPGMLQKSLAFVPRYYKFESTSLQRGVMQTIGSALGDELGVTEIRDGLSKRLSGQGSQEPQSLGWPISVVIVKVPGCISRVPFARG
jgi:hypothetical protein